MYTLGQIGNANQTLLNCDMPVAYIVNGKGVKQVKVKTAGNKKQCTTVMCCMADG